MDEGRVQKKQKKLNCFVDAATSKLLMGVLDSLTKVKDKTKTVLVPGSVHVPGSAVKSYLMAVEFITDTLADIVRFFVELHYLGLSFDGKLTLGEMFRTLNGGIRILDTALSKLKESTPGAEEKDMKALGASIRADMFDGKTMPTDVAHLVDILETKYQPKPELYVAVYNHPGLLKQGPKLAQFGLLYMGYRFLEKTDPAKYASINKRMPHCDEDLNHWKYRALKNEYLESIVFYKQDQIHPQSRKYANPPTNIKKQMRNAYQPPKNLKPTEAFRIHRAINAYPKLATDAKMHIALRRHVTATMAKGLSSIPAPDPAGDRKLLVKLVLDDMSNYNNEGDGMTRNMRNSFQHVPDAWIEQQAAAAAAAAPAVAPVVAPRFHEIEAIFGEEYPGALCDFYMAMVSEKELDYLKDVQTYLSNFS